MYDTEILTRADVRAALTEARAAAELEFDAWWSGYSCGACGGDVELQLRRLKQQLGRALQSWEVRDVRRGHAEGSRDRRACAEGAGEQRPVRPSDW
jgi:hypothetical protein